MRLFRKNTPTIYAGFWRRFLAVILDCIAFFLVTAPVLYLFYGHDYFFWLFNNDALFASYGILDFVINKFVVVILLVLFWQTWGATPGKRLLGCRIVNAADLQPISVKQSIIRIAGYVVAMLPAYLGFIWAAWDKRKQGLHDKLASTVVIRDDDDYAKISTAEFIRTTPL